MIRRKRKLIELIRNYSRHHHHYLNTVDLETEEKFHKSLNDLAEYIDQIVFLPACDDCFNAEHPERERRKK